MQLGFVTFEGMGYADPLERAAEWGFDFVELQFAYVAAGSSRLGREYLAERADEIRALLKDTEVDLVVHLPHTMDIGASSPPIRQASVEETKQCLRVAAALGAEQAVLHPTSSARTRVWDPELVREWVLESVQELDTFGREVGVELCVENLYSSLFTVDEFDRFFTETECAMTLDTGHTRVSGYNEADIATFCHEHADRIRHVHANDNKAFVVEAGEPPSDDHVPTGAGDPDFGTALAPLTDGWDGTVSLEMHTATLEYVKVAKRQFESML